MHADPRAMAESVRARLAKAIRRRREELGLTQEAQHERDVRGEQGAV